MMKATTENIQKILSDMDHQPEFQEETKQVYTILKKEGREFPLFIRVFPNGDLLQLLIFFPVETKKETLGDLARILHLFNKELDIPGFGLDEMEGVVFFRIMLPTPKGECDEEIFKAYVNTCRLACETFSQTIEAISTGIAQIDEIIEQAQKQMHRLKP